MQLTLGPLEEMAIPRSPDSRLCEVRNASLRWRVTVTMMSRTLLGFGSVLVSAYLMLGVPHEKPVAMERSPWRAWLEEDAVYIITESEKAVFTQLRTDQDREKFVDDFWHSRNPTVTQDNAFKEEHYRRIAYADAHFSSTVPGWKTDRGRLYITYGPPDEFEMHGSTEDWTYRLLDGIGRNVRIRFVDQSLSPESSAKLAASPVPCLFGNCPEPLPEPMNEFTRLERLANWEKSPPRPRFKELVAMVGPDLKTNSLPVTFQATCTRVTNATASVELTLTFKDHDLKYVSQGIFSRANVIIYGQVSTLDGAISDWFEGTLNPINSGEMRTQMMNASQRYHKHLLLLQGIYRLKVVAKDTNASTFDVSEIALDLVRQEQAPMSRATVK